MTNQYFDLLIVGAGPVGSMLCSELLKLNKSLKICILEEHLVAGTPQQCSGLFSKNITSVAKINEKEIIQKITGADFYSPSGFKLTLNSKKIQAYVIDRTIFDLKLANNAEKSGAKILYNTKFLDAKQKKQNNKKNKKNEKIYEIKIFDKIAKKQKIIYSKYIAGCDGATSAVAKTFSFPKMKCLYGYGIILKAKTNQDIEFIKTNKVALYFGKKIAPDFFLWKIPRASESTIEIGVASVKNPSDLIEKFIEKNQINKKNIIKKIAGLIPFEMRKQIIKDNVILVGDAAGQVKATTGGGVIYGIKSAKIAAKSIFMAHKNNDAELLNNYSVCFNKSLGAELKKLKFIRNFINSRTDNQINSAIKNLNKKQIIEFVKNYGDMDSASPLIFALLKHQELWLDFIKIVYVSI